MKTREEVRTLNATERALLNETLEWSGNFLTAYARLQTAERMGEEAAYDQAWGDLLTALFLLKDKAEQIHDLLDQG